MIETFFENYNATVNLYKKSRHPSATSLDFERFSISTIFASIKPQYYWIGLWPTLYINITYQEHFMSSSLTSNHPEAFTDEYKVKKSKVRVENFYADDSSVLKTVEDRFHLRYCLPDEYLATIIRRDSVSVLNHQWILGIFKFLFSAYHISFIRLCLQKHHSTWTEKRR